jgi:light-regulated signal transduction histidine kinase (bacteriophytochrome)/HAMP domain-containing protein
MNKIVFAASVITAFLAVSLGLFISRSIYIPLAELKKAAVEIGKGKLDNRIKIKSTDEIGQLADSFNKMAEDLQKTTTSIDRLNAANQQLQAGEQQLKAANQQLQSEIAERKKAEEALEASNRELKDFVYIASHDLREPLRKIFSFGELLKDSLEDKLEEDDKENLGFMVDGANRMTAMIEGLLTYSRLNKNGAAFEAVDLNEIVEQLRTLELAELLEETGAAIEVPEPLPKVQADPVQIRQLLQNLVINGIRYRREGIQPRVVIRAEQIADGRVRVEVQDNGIGIAKEYEEDIFKMFRRLHSRQKYDGTGIGLAVCKKIVERHNGQIGVESEAGAGSTFWFTLPVSESLKAEQMKLVSSLET